MSVSDPLLDDMKGCVQQFFDVISNGDQITDNSFYFIHLCRTLEKIFRKGVISQQNTLNFNRILDPYAWMHSIRKSESDTLSYTYKNCVDNVKERNDLLHNSAKFRLLIKYCLAKKCLHVPVELLIRTNKKHLFYKSNSIFGDEILAEIFLSVLLQISKINFTLDLSNSSFLDTTWYIPEVVHLELVPCQNLGLGVRWAARCQSPHSSKLKESLKIFSEQRAVIITIEPNSVAAEEEDIKIGDVLDKVNGMPVTSNSKGRLNAIFRKNKSKPVNLTIIKAYNPETKEFFAPIKLLLNELEVDLDTIIKQYEDPTDNESIKKISSGFDVKYLGYVDVGSVGNVKQVVRALNMILTNTVNNEKSEDNAVTKINREAIFEIREMGVCIKDSQTDEIILEHPYMQISSCGNIPILPRNFGYCASDENCEVASHFNCHIFEVNLTEDADAILHSIGQGFRRTHFAV